MFQVKESLTMMEEFLVNIPPYMEVYGINRNIVAPKRSAKASTNSFPGD
jgi:hypothetical protein